MVMVVLSSGNRMKSNLSRNFFLSSYPETTYVFSRWEMSPRLTLVSSVCRRARTLAGFCCKGMCETG